MPGGTLSGVSGGGIMYRETYFDVNVKEIGLKCISMYILLCKTIMYIYLLPKYNSLYDFIFSERSKMLIFASSNFICDLVNVTYLILKVWISALK